MAAAIEPGVAVVGVDLGAVTVVDVAGLRGLAALRSRLEAAGVTLQLRSVRPLTRRLIHHLGDADLSGAAGGGAHG